MEEIDRCIGLSRSNKCSNLKGEWNLFIKLEGGESGKEVMKKVIDRDDKRSNKGESMDSRGETMATRS